MGMVAGANNHHPDHHWQAALQVCVLPCFWKSAEDTPCHTGAFPSVTPRTPAGNFPNREGLPPVVTVDTATMSNAVVVAPHGRLLPIAVTLGLQCAGVRAGACSPPQAVGEAEFDRWAISEARASSIDTSHKNAWRYFGCY